MLYVESDVYNMDFWMLPKLEYTNYQIIPIQDYRKVKEILSSTNDHVVTGLATVEIPKEIVDFNQAINFAQEKLDRLSCVISFAQGRNVYFQRFTCYQIVNGIRENKMTQYPSMRVGKSRGGLNVYPDGLEKFINIVMPKLENEEFNKKTGVYFAIQWYNEAQNLNVVEIKYPVLWIAMELIANFYCKQNPHEFFLPRAEWKSLNAEVNTLLDRLSIQDREKRKRIINALGYAQQGFITDRIGYLLSGYGLSQYIPELPEMNQIRNDIMHGRKLDYSQNRPIDLMLKLERLLLKLIFKILDVYNQRFIHSAIQNDNLRADH